jgi:hypothetical protein
MLPGVDAIGQPANLSGSRSFERLDGTCAEDVSEAAGDAGHSAKG